MMTEPTQTKANTRILATWPGGSGLLTIAELLALPDSAVVLPGVPPVVTPVLPTLPPSVADQTGVVGTDFRLVLPDFGVFVDVTDLPPGLMWDGATRTISGKPRKADSRIISVKSVKGVHAAFRLTISGQTKPWPGKPEPLPPAPDNQRPAEPALPAAEGDQSGETDITIMNETNS